MNDNDGFSIDFASLQDEIWAAEGCNSVVEKALDQQVQDPRFKPGSGNKKEKIVGLPEL